MGILGRGTWTGHPCLRWSCLSVLRDAEAYVRHLAEDLVLGRRYVQPTPQLHGACMRNRTGRNIKYRRRSLHRTHAPAAQRDLLPWRWAGTPQAAGEPLSRCRARDPRQLGAPGPPSLPNLTPRQINSSRICRHRGHTVRYSRKCRYRKRS